MSDSLIDRVLAAKNAAEEANVSKGAEAQQAAMLIAQVQVILAGETFTVEATNETETEK
jgi:hypothetical protein